jgi:hypothetical protein
MTVQECGYQDAHLGLPSCGEPAVFSVRTRHADPVRPDPAKDNEYCCREHLPVTVELVDEDAETGFVVHVSVIASSQARRKAGETAWARGGRP